MRQPAVLCSLEMKRNIITKTIHPPNSFAQTTSDQRTSRRDEEEDPYELMPPDYNAEDEEEDPYEIPNRRRVPTIRRPTILPDVRGGAEQIQLTARPTALRDGSIFDSQLSLNYSVSSDCSTADLNLSDQELSLRLNSAMSTQGLTKENMKFQAMLSDLLDDIWCPYNIKVVGPFAETWGYNLFKGDGTAGPSSRIEWAFVDKSDKVHPTSSCKCPSGGLMADVEDASRTLGLPESSSVEADLRSLPGSADSPSVSVKSYREACSYPWQPDNIQNLPPNIYNEVLPIKPLVVTESSCEVSQHGRKRLTVSGRISCVNQDKVIMRSLTTEQGQFYVLLRYILEQGLQYQRQRIFAEGHSKTLLFLSLCKTPRENWKAELLVTQLRDALRTLEALLKSSRSGILDFYAQSSMSMLAERSEALKAVQGCLKTTLTRVLSSYIHALEALIPDDSSNFYFQPLLMTFPGRGDLPSQRSFASLPTLVYEVLQMLLVSKDFDKDLLRSYLVSLQGLATTIYMCMQCLTFLKTGHAGEVRGFLDKALQRYRKPRRCLTTEGQKSKTSLKTEILSADSCLCFHCHLDKVIEGTSGLSESQLACHWLGLDFMESIDIREIFFPCRRTALGNNGLRAEFNIYINFYALLQMLIAHWLPEKFQLSNWMTDVKAELLSADLQEIFCLVVNSVDFNELGFCLQRIRSVQSLYKHSDDLDPRINRYLTYTELKLVFYWSQALVDIETPNFSQLLRVCDSILSKIKFSLLQESKVALIQLQQNGNSQFKSTNTWKSAVSQVYLSVKMFAKSKNPFPPNKTLDPLLLKLFAGFLGIFKNSEIGKLVSENFDRCTKPSGHSSYAASTATTRRGHTFAFKPRK